MDINGILKLKTAWDRFAANHPKFPAFIKAAKERGAVEGMTVGITLTYPDGTTMRSGIRVKESDRELLQTIAALAEAER